MTLPSGTITFLFTDIEGSTKLWDGHPAQMAGALRRHDELLRRAIEEHEGHVFKTIGDAFCAAFPTAPDALKAALKAQADMSAEPWPHPIALKVRMAMHTGSAEVRDNDYFGPALNRVARLLSTGHGGQVLLSGISRDLCRDLLPSDCTLKPLGEHRLKDLGRPESVFQLCHPNLSADFPSLKSLEHLPNNLPQQLTSFVGRESETAMMRDLLGRARLLTLTGSGGCGKTRLSLQVAAEVLDTFADGAWLVELAPITDPELVPRAVAGVLRLKDEPGTPALQRIKEHLREKRLMLVLDNCEHLLDASANVADEILRHCPNVKIVASSREGLGVSGEVTYRVPSLSSPSPAHFESVESLAQYEAVRLFVDRAVLHDTAFAVTNENAPAVASVCHRLDGIPLAIELAAARLRSMSVGEVNQRLDQRFRLLTGGSRTALPRQQTLRSLIDWSYNLLNEPEKALLGRLSVFSGGWMLEAAEKVCSGPQLEDWEVLDHLSSLVDKSLVAFEQREGATRYRLLETVRQYASDRMIEGNEGNELRERHLDYFEALLEDLGPRFITDPQRTFGIVETELGNVRAALSWAMEGSERAGKGIRLAGNLGFFWFVRGYLREGRDWASKFVALDSVPEDAAHRAKLLRFAGMMAMEMADYSAALPLLEEALEFSRRHARVETEAATLMSLGTLAEAQADFTVAKEMFERALTLSRERCSEERVASALLNLADSERALGHSKPAREIYEEALALVRKQNRPRGVAHALHGLARLAADEGDYSAARPLLDQSLAIRRELGDPRGIADSLTDSALMQLAEGPAEIAKATFLEGYSLFSELGVRIGQARCLEGLGYAATAANDALTAARHWGAAERLREQISAPRVPNERRLFDRYLSTARALLADDSAFDAAWREGRTDQRMM